MAVILTLIWLPVGKYPGACGVDPEATLGAFKLCIPVAFFTAVEVAVAGAVDGFVLVAMAASDFWIEGPFPVANPAAAMTGDVRLPSGAWAALPGAWDKGLIKVACKTFPVASFVAGAPCA
jgi:hypothetical protein